MLEKAKNTIITFIVSCLALFGFVSVQAASIAPDKAQQALDLLAVECQNLSDYALYASYGDYSGFNEAYHHFSIAVDNVSLLLNGYGRSIMNDLYRISGNLNQDPGSAANAAEECSRIRGNLYQELQREEKYPYPNNYDECVHFGYRVNNGICFIGGNPVYDEDGNLIGYYNTDCFDGDGFHQGTCWDCYYGADYNGCISKR